MSENDDYLRPWASDMLRVGAVDNRGNLSERALAKIAGVSNATVSRTLKGLQTPGARTVEKIAIALEIDPTEVWRRLGVERDHQAPYEPPSEAAFLSHRERKLVTEMIRVLVEGRHAQPEQNPVPADHDLPLADRPEPHGTTTSRRLSVLPGTLTPREREELYRRADETDLESEPYAAARPDDNSDDDEPV